MLTRNDDGNHVMIRRTKPDSLPIGTASWGERWIAFRETHFTPRLRYSDRGKTPEAAMSVRCPDPGPTLIVCQFRRPYQEFRLA